MADAADVAPGLIFPRDTFASLAPRPFLLSHLKLPTPARPSGRSPEQFRTPTINTGSLSHSNGSAVVRVGDTAVVCGVRAEILLASDIPSPPGDDINDDETIEHLGLIVPNLELSTGCSPAHLPGNAPGSVAQSLSYRISRLLNDSGAITADDLRVQYVQPASDGETTDEAGKTVTKAFWTLYVDILCLALDGNALDAAWLAVSAALHDTRLPSARWDPDRECVVCSPLSCHARSLQIRDLPSVTTFGVFTTASPLKAASNTHTWLLADPDAFEEENCTQSLTIAIRPNGGDDQLIAKLESSGGKHVNRQTVQTALQLAKAQFQLTRAIMLGA
ncbi:hypothetical protein CERZMDRAFT_102389 [Cercospora zeae-maydis SCOH1-5]|uniref:Ribosomal RNA-processing protein 43 n=1 Tax=Cercospora zeae-maydis SCOH1-5 TaxID=717836 RepID=A0A6A6F149_9PEZI|nr:hypothetical protein CERZMDRAFT_102389 [Cercospora zeae-maydis SCOH1-5]